MSYLDKRSFRKMRTQIESYDKKREQLIKSSRDVLKNSKRVIYSLHRENKEDAKTLLKSLEESCRNLKKVAGKDNNLRKEGSFRVAMQEYTEAVCFYKFIKDETIPDNAELDVGAEDYLMGLCDLTGELGRRAVILATKKNLKEVETIRDIMQEIFGQILELNPRNNELRKKSDSIKWNVKKVEELIYDSRKDQAG